MSDYVLFPDPIDSHCELRFDNGTIVVGVPYVHSTRRIGQKIHIPQATPQGNGANLSITHPVTLAVINQRGTLWYQDGNQNFPFPEGDCFIWFDDFRLQMIAPCPPVNPPIPPANDRTPEQIIHDVYKTGLYDLTTHDGCGVFTEACCSALHDNHSVSWGHIKKTGAQEQYNGHAIDAVQLLNSMPDCDRGIYDIIRQSQAPDAQPSFNRVSDPNSLLWYYPA